MTKFLGSPKKACYLMAVTIVGFGLIRDALSVSHSLLQPNAFSRLSVSSTPVSSPAQPLAFCSQL